MGNEGGAGEGVREIGVLDGGVGWEGEARGVEGKVVGEEGTAEEERESKDEEAFGKERRGDEESEETVDEEG